MNSFYSQDELLNLGFNSIGNNVLISKKASIYGAKNISIGNNVRIDDFCILSGNIKIGNNIHISAYSALFAGNIGIELEDYSGISSRTTIYAISDDYSGEFLTNPTIPEEFRNVYGGKVVLKKHSIIGASSLVLPNVVIKEGAAIGAQSLVTKDCDEWSIYVGIPVKKIKDRSKKLLEFEKNLEF